LLFFYKQQVWNALKTRESKFQTPRWSSNIKMDA
jgi:hypothetical protein